MLVPLAATLLRCRRSLRALAPLGLALLVTAGCGGSTPPPAATPKRAPVVKTPAAQAKAPAPEPMLPAHVLAQLDDEDSTPYFARRGNEALLLYAAGGRWRTVVVGENGAPKGEAADVGPAPADSPIGALRAVAGGYLAVWIATVQGNHEVRALSLDAAGKATAPASLVQHSAEEIAWLDILPNAKGALLLWEVPRADRADVLMSVIQGGAGRPSAVVTVAREVLGWQAIGTERGAAVAIVKAPPPTPARRPAAAAAAAAADAKVGAVSLIEIDAAGKVSAPVTVSAEPTAQIDVQISALEGRYLLAWTDERDIDGSVYVAVVEPGGKAVAAPRRATPPAGEQALVSLVTAPYTPVGGARSKRALLAWEDLLRAPRDGRLIHMATLGPDGGLGAERVALVFSASGPPDIVADGDGFAAVTLAPAARVAGDALGEPPIWPAYVRFGADLSVRAAEPVRAAPFAATDGVPYLVRQLSCEGGACATLASAADGEVATPGAQGGGAKGTANADPRPALKGTANADPRPASKTPLVLVSLPVRASGWRAPALREDRDPPPRATSVKAIFDGDHLARVAAAEVGDGSALAAWVTYYLEGASEGVDRRKEAGATLAVRAVGGPLGAGAAGKLHVVSQKASSLGGVALAAAPPDAKGKVETALAWVAREKGEAQVYVTKLDAAGGKLEQKKVTVIGRRSKGGTPNEASDVAVAWDGEGWTLAWIDTRDGNAEVYVARVDRSLRKTVPDRRVTDAPGDAGEVQIAVRGKEIWLVWSDTRQGTDEGGAEIYLARLDGKTLEKLGPETRLFASPEHSRTPSIAPFGGGLVAAWIEEPVAGSAGSGAVRLAQLDERGAMVGAPVAVSGGSEGSASSVAVTCDKVCRGVVASLSGDSLSLGAFGFTPGGAPASAVKPLMALTGSSAQDVSPALAGASASSLFFADDALSGSGRVRWMRIEWP